jgi:hypothetical protein
MNLLWRIQRLLKQLENFGRSMRGKMGAYECEYCGSDDVFGEFIYPNWNDDPEDTCVLLCDECARGAWCLGCGSFTGGTEDIFRYGAWECSQCHGWLRDEFPEAYDDEEDEGDWYDPDLDFGFEIDPYARWSATPYPGESLNL